MRELTYEDSQSKQNPMKEYMESLRNQDDIFSGDEYLLPSDLLKIYGKYEIACEEYHSARCSGLVCKEDLEYDQMSLVEYIDPFTGEPVKKNKK